VQALRNHVMTFSSRSGRATAVVDRALSVSTGLVSTPQGAQYIHCVLGRREWFLRLGDRRARLTARVPAASNHSARANVVLLHLPPILAAK